MTSKTRRSIDEAKAYVNTMSASELWDYFCKTDGFKLKATSKAEAGNYSVTITFEDKRTGEEGLFKITGNVTVVAPSIDPDLSLGYWDKDVLTIPGVFNKDKKFDLSVDLKNAFVINIEGVSDPKMEFKLNREDLAGCIDIEGSKVTWVKNLEDEEGNVTENLFGKELEFTVVIKNGELKLAEKTYKLKFINPLAEVVTWNNVKHTLANDKDGQIVSSFDLYRLLSFKDTQSTEHELFNITSKGTTLDSDGNFTTIGTTCYELNKNNVKFEILTPKSNLSIDENGLATWENVPGAAFVGATVDVKVTITHNYGTSTGTISLKINEKVTK